jgi:hypothetical protein
MLSTYRQCRLWAGSDQLAVALVLELVGGRLWGWKMCGERNQEKARRRFKATRGEN